MAIRGGNWSPLPNFGFIREVNFIRERGSSQEIGLVLEKCPGELAGNKFSCIVISVDKSSMASVAGIHAGDCVIKVGRVSVADLGPNAIYSLIYKSFTVMAREKSYNTKRNMEEVKITFCFLDALKLLRKVQLEQELKEKLTELKLTEAKISQLEEELTFDSIDSHSGPRVKPPDSLSIDDAVIQEIDEFNASLSPLKKFDENQNDEEEDSSDKLNPICEVKMRRKPNARQYISTRQMIDRNSMLLNRPIEIELNEEEESEDEDSVSSLPNFSGIDETDSPIRKVPIRQPSYRVAIGGHKQFHFSSGPSKSSTKL